VNRKNAEPLVSIIVPVLNEGPAILETIRRVRETAGRDYVEIIVVDGDPAGGTVNLVEDESVVVVRAPRGRGAQMNRGAEAAKGDILLFLHADTVLPEHAFRLIGEALGGPRYVGGAFDLGIDSPRPLLRLTARCASLKHRLTRVPYGDQAIFIRTGYFRDAGGYREIPIFEDVELMRRIKKSGGRIIILPARTRTSPRKWERDGALFCILRNWTLQILHLLGVPPESLVKYYYRDDRG
jgi:rSAM/selenodomain-associated transferase 2